MYISHILSCFQASPKLFVLFSPSFPFDASSHGDISFHILQKVSFPPIVPNITSRINPLPSFRKNTFTKKAPDTCKVIQCLIPMSYCNALLQCLTAMPYCNALLQCLIPIIRPPQKSYMSNHETHPGAARYLSAIPLPYPSFYL